MATAHSGQISWVNQMAVDPVLVNQGIGTLLLAHAMRTLVPPIRLYSYSPLRTSFKQSEARPETWGSWRWAMRYLLRIVVGGMRDGDSLSVIAKAVIAFLLSALLLVIAALFTAPNVRH